MKPGLTDYVLDFPEGNVYVEVKTPTGRLNEAQETFRDECRLKRRPHHVVHSLDEFMKLEILQETIP